MRNRKDSYIKRVSKPQKESVGEDMHFKLAVDFIEQRIDSSATLKLLDMGCNIPPAFLDYLTARHDNIEGFGCDIREGTVSGRVCEGRVRIDAVDISTSKDAYPHDTFDFIYSGEVIEHLKDTDNLLLQSLDYLRHGGYLIITTPNFAAWYERLLLLFGQLPVMAEVSDSGRVFGRRRLYRLMGKEHSASVGHLRLFTPAALKELCEHHGFELVTHEGYWTLDFFLNRWISRIYRNMAQGIFMVFRKP